MTFPLKLILTIVALLLVFWTGLNWVSMRSSMGSENPETLALTWQLSQPSAATTHREIRVDQGDSVELTVVTDFADALHVHGYDLHLPLEANSQNRLIIFADRAGRFDIELHGLETHIGALVVNPR